jgi:class 3 adenylate cyclase/tetratricopeptide (TPR) repeat protein
MRCSNCKTENPAGKKFCGDCGAALANLCPKCGADNPAGKHFCGECGTALGAPAPAASAKKSNDSPIRVAETPALENLEGERKTVTALFADIKGSTELEQDLDPEEARAIIDPALKLMIDAVRRYDGYIVQSTGDGIFGLFGAPVAHEDHPQRALYAALRMQEEIRRYAERLRADGRAPIQIRVGANTGEVVVRSITTGAGQVEYTPIGHTTNLASRMQTLADPGATVISESTRGLVEGYFALKSLGASRVKGIAEPVNVYEIIGLGPLRTRLQRSAGRGLTKFVGRERELEAMKAAVAQANSGHGQIVAAMAEAGVGKSRLLFEFKATSQSGWMVLEAFSVSHGKASSYLPVIDLMQSYFRITGEDDQRGRREKVAGRLSILDPSLEEARPYLFALLGIVEGDDPLAGMDPQIRKRRTLDAIKRILLRESLNQPLMVIFEDLHWVDDETQAFLNRLADSIGTAKILLLVNYRPTYSHQWGSKTYYTQLRLDPLGKESAEEMLSALVGDEEAVRPLKRLIIERTHGNPFFIEETVLVLFDEGALVRDGTAVKLTRPLDTLKIPPTVQSILAARIDRLASDHKDLLQTLAVMGMEFPLSLIRAVTARADDELYPMLSELQLAEFIYEQPALGDVEYRFKHALTREVAYNSVLIERRRLLHERVGEAIEALFKDRIDDHIAELAHHYSHTANTRKAVDYLFRAASRSADRSAYSEAIARLSDAVELLKRLPDDAERARQELSVQSLLGLSLANVKGWAAPGVEPAYARARELCAQIIDPPLVFRTLSGQWLFRYWRIELDKALVLADEILVAAENAKDPAMLFVGNMARGHVLFERGEFVPSNEYEEKALAVFDPRQPLPAALEAWRLGALMYLSSGLLWLGYPDRAWAKSREMLELARMSSDPYVLAQAYNYAAILNVLRRDGTAAQKYAEDAMALTEELGLATLSALATTYHGAALIAQGRCEEGIAGMRLGISLWRATGGTPLNLYSCLLAQGLGRAGRPQEGLEEVEEGLASVARVGQWFADPLLHHAKGELLLAQNPSDGAKAELSFRTAIEIARGQSSRTMELRATTSLARLLDNHSNRDEARTMLSDIYHWFTEGFDTADLKDAKALLKDLNA